tara:strand:- start:256 stop:468 length:213 start_codon:yes stop_codon:yes gene_type:complete
MRRLVHTWVLRSQSLLPDQRWSYPADALFGREIRLAAPGNELGVLERLAAIKEDLSDARCPYKEIPCVVL